MLQVALPVFVYQATGSASSAAVAMVTGVVPMVILSPVAGVLADRWDRRRLLWGVCIAQGLVAAPLLTIDGGAPTMIYLVMAAQSGLAALFEPTRNALVPALVSTDLLTAANGLMGFNSSVSRLIGSSLGGVILGFGGLSWVVGVYTIALLSATLLLLPRFDPATVQAIAMPEKQPMFRDWLDGLAEFRRQRTLRLTGVTLALAALAQGMFLVLFVVFVTGPLHGGEAEVGLLRGVQAVGGLAAGILIATLLRRAAPVAVMGGGALALGLASVVIWNLPHLTTVHWIYFVLFSALGAPAALNSTGAITVMQTAAAPNRTGRVLATTFAVIAGFQAIGMLAAGALVSAWKLGWLLNLQATLIIIAGLTALIGLRSSRVTASQDRDLESRPAQAGISRGGERPGSNKSSDVA